MLLKYFYDTSLAHASYLVGCQKTGEAIVVDPGRDIAPYVQAARANGMKIVGATETHIHADFVSGASELASECGARLYLSDEGPADWKYKYTTGLDCKLVREGDVIHVGKIKLEVLHTPGHTPESISLVLTDEGGGANLPMGIFTGDFVFVGSTGRPDLLETAAGVVGSADLGARELFASIRKFHELPDHLQVWPAHGAGSACGKGLGAIPSSTVGYEKLFNSALQYTDEQKFVDYILADQPETPPYFAVMKRVNKTGPALLKNLPPVIELDAGQLAKTAADRLVIDTCPAAEFAQAHVAGTINLPQSSLVQWAGFFVDHATQVFLVCGREIIGDIVRKLHSIGIDNIGGWFDAEKIPPSKLRTESFAELPPGELKSRIESGEVELVDVRARTEWDEGHIAQAEHFFLGNLLKTAGQIPFGKTVVTQCRSGARSAIAASILKRAGADVINLQGGITAWEKSGLPVTAPSTPVCKG